MHSLSHLLHIQMLLPDRMLFAACFHTCMADSHGSVTHIGRSPNLVVIHVAAMHAGEDLCRCRCSCMDEDLSQATPKPIPAQIEQR